MGKNRMVDTKFWEDNYISDLTSNQKYLFLYFLTCPSSNIAGIYEITIKKISFETGLPKGEIEDILKQFSDDKKIYYFDGWVYLKNFEKYQVERGSSKIIIGVDNIKKKLPNKIKEKIANISDNISYEYPMKGHTYPPNYSDSDSDSDSDILSPLPLFKNKTHAQPTGKNRFIPPTVEMVRAYCDERKNTIDPEQFIDYYESNGWLVGNKGKMKNWQASVRTWERNNKVSNQNLTNDQKIENRGRELIRLKGVVGASFDFQEEFGEQEYLKYRDKLFEGN